MSLTKVDDDSKSFIFDFLNDSKFRVTQSELVLDENKDLTTEIVLLMWRHFRNNHPIGQSLGHLPPPPEVSQQEYTKLQPFYNKFLPIFIGLVNNPKDGYIQILSNFRLQPYIRIIKIENRIYTLKRPFTRSNYDQISDSFLKTSNKLMYFGHMLVIMLNEDEI